MSDVITLDKVGTIRMRTTDNSSMVVPIGDGSVVTLSFTFEGVSFAPSLVGTFSVSGRIITVSVLSFNGFPSPEFTIQMLANSSAVTPTQINSTTWTYTTPEDVEDILVTWVITALNGVLPNATWEDQVMIFGGSALPTINASLVGALSPATLVSEVSIPSIASLSGALSPATLVSEVSIPSIASLSGVLSPATLVSGSFSSSIAFLDQSLSTAVLTSAGVVENLTGSTVPEAFTVGDWRLEVPVVDLGVTSSVIVEGRTVRVGVTSSGEVINVNDYTFVMRENGTLVSPVFIQPSLWVYEVGDSGVSTEVTWSVIINNEVVSSGTVNVPANLSSPAPFAYDDWEVVSVEDPATAPAPFDDDDWAVMSVEPEATSPESFADDDWELELVTNTAPPPEPEAGLSAPQAVSATTQSDEIILVSWTAPATGTPTAYDVDYSTNQAQWTTVANRTSPASIQLPIGGQDYFFRVRSRNATSSATSGTVTARTHVRPYGKTAEWNIPISQVLARGAHPNEDYIRDVLWLGNEAPGGGLNTGTGVSWINFFSRDYTYPVYKSSDANGQTATVAVSAGNWRSGVIPWNPNWTIPGGTDAQIIVLDEATGVEYNGWNLRYDAGTNRMVSRDGNTARMSRVTADLDGGTTSTPGDFRTKTNGFVPSRGCGIQYLAMLITPEEIAQGRIYHAVSVPMRRSGFRYFSSPATKGERFPGNEADQGIPQGTRFWLDISDAEIDAHVASWPAGVPQTTRDSMRIVFRAMREYGCIATDQSGDNHVQFQHEASTNWGPYGMLQTLVNGKFYPRDAIDGLITNRNRIRVVRPPDGVLHRYAVGNDVPRRAPALLTGTFTFRLPGGGSTTSQITTVGIPQITRSGSTFTLSRRAQFFGENPVTLGTPTWFRGSTQVGTGLTLTTTTPGTYLCVDSGSNANGTTTANSNTITI